MFRDAILDARGDLWINGTSDQALLLEVAQGFSKYLVRNVGH
jgi:hypothetical protein